MYWEHAKSSELSIVQKILTNASALIGDLEKDVTVIEGRATLSHLNCSSAHYPHVPPNKQLHIMRDRTSYHNSIFRIITIHYWNI